MCHRLGLRQHSFNMGRTKTLQFMLLILTIPGILCDLSGIKDMLHSKFDEQWIPKGVPDKYDLRCTEEQFKYCHHQEYSMSKDTCCTCAATPIWIGNETSLFIEYVSVLGKAIALKDQIVDADNDTKVYKIEHTEEELTEIPINICNNGYQGDRILSQIIIDASSFANITSLWPRIVNIDLTYNKITHIGDITCLKALDTLKLSYNRIEHISNSSFSSLTHLRTLQVDHNRIKSMDTFVLAAETVHIAHIDISENELKELDVTNFISVNQFCNLDYTGNVIERLTNVHNISLDTSKQYEGGFVSLKGNLFKTFPDLTKLLNFDKMEKLGAVLNLGFDFRESSIGCDCVMEPYIEKAISFVKTYWRDYMDVKCDSPPTLFGKSVINVTLDDFVCDIKPNKGCPSECKCIDIPSKSTLFVDCANKGLKQFPQLPVSNYSNKISLNLSGNHITSILGNVPYLDKLSNLDLSKNQLKEFTEDAAKLLKNAVIDISDNSKITSIPQVIQSQSMCSIRMDNIILDCGCNSGWLESWMDIKKCQNKSNVLCNVEGKGIIPAEEFNEDMLDCSTYNLFLLQISVSMASLILALTIAMTLLFQFRHEILVILLKLRQKNSNTIQPMFKYDAYLSYDTENDDLRKWVCLTLIKYLEGKGYRLFLPMRDIPFGEVRSTATIDVLRTTRSFILILSESYLTQEDQIWTDNEWKYGWNMYKADSTKNIVLINYDHVSSFDVEHPQIKAFLRFGSQIDFFNSERNILELICNKLGPVCSVKEKFNAKKVFNPAELFQVNNVLINDGKQGLGPNDKTDIFEEKKLNNQGFSDDDFDDNNDDDFSDYGDDFYEHSRDDKEEHVTDNDIESKRSMEGIWTVIDGNIEIKEKNRPTGGTHKYWE